MGCSYRWFNVYLALDLINNVGNWWVSAHLCAIGHARSLRRSRVNNWLKHTLRRFIPPVDSFQCMITYIKFDWYRLRDMKIDSREPTSATSIGRSTWSGQNLAFNLLLYICRAIQQHQNTLPIYRSSHMTMPITRTLGVTIRREDHNSTTRLIYSFVGHRIIHNRFFGMTTNTKYNKVLTN